jgi:hypothetical protein
MAEQNFEFYKIVVRDAYSRPFYQNVDMKRQLVRDFREHYERECYQVIGWKG